MNQTSISSYPKYPAYKDSGVEWLGEIPEGWDNNKLKHLCSIYNGDSLNEFQKKKYDSDNPIDRPYISSKDINVNDSSVNYENGLRIPIENTDLKIAKKNSVLLCIEGGSAGKKIAFTNQSVCFVNKLACFDGYQNRINKKYLFYSLKASPFKTQFNLSMSGLIGGVAVSIIKNIYIPTPPLPEQTAIAHFLDDKTAKIDRAIAQKEQLIALLKERKQIIIQNAVTKGLDPKVKLKDSGVEWIGEIPEEWEVKPLRFIGSTQNGISAGAEYFGEGFPFVSYGDVYKNIELPEIVNGLAKSSDDDRENYSVREGDVFFTRTSETIEEIGFSSTCLKTIENATFAGFLIRFRPSPKVLEPTFSKYYFSSKLHRAFFVKEMNLVIRASLSQELLKKLPVLLPPLAEQKLIAKSIETQSAKIDQAISLQQTQIEKLKEYKATLIDSAVTGKICVMDNGQLIMSGNIVHIKSYAFALRVVRLYEYLSTEKKEYVLSKQLLRSGTAIGALVKESEHAQSKADFINKMNVGLKEANETIYWLELLKDSDYIDEIAFNSIHQDAVELLKLLISIVKTSKQKL